jgi:OOP family OmpA-OmpF porin
MTNLKINKKEKLNFSFFKKSFFFIQLWSLFSIKLAFSQEQFVKKEKVFNAWSVEFGLGQSKPIAPFAPGYYSVNPSKSFVFSGINHFFLGFRYMLSDIFGLKIDYARDSFSNQDNTTSLSFNTYQNRYGFQGVVNLGKLLRFDSFSKRIGVLSHGGLQYSHFYVNDGINKGIAENNVGLIFGISPQFYVSKKQC